MTSMEGQAASKATRANWAGPTDVPTPPPPVEVRIRGWTLERITADMAQSQSGCEP